VRPSRRRIALIAILLLISFLIVALVIPTENSKNVAVLLDRVNIGEDVVAKVVERANNGQLGPWNRTTSYPSSTYGFINGISCVASGGYIYCIGGFNGTSLMDLRAYLNRTYYARLSPTGVGPWMRATDYPIETQGQSCVASSSYIYCVGGLGHPTHIIDVYYASLSPSGIGPWARTTTYPYPVYYPHCMTDSSRIYCVAAHYNGTAYPNTADVYFAQLSTTGVGSWTALPQLPFNPSGCVASGGYAYCFGGGSCAPILALDDRCSSPSYYAPLSPNGTRSWSRTADLPTAVYNAYVTAESYVYYFGSTSYPGPPLYFAHLSSSGMSSWVKTTPYHGAPAACVASDGYMYCVGGEDIQCDIAGPMCVGYRRIFNNVYFTRIGS